MHVRAAMTTWGVADFTCASLFLEGLDKVGLL